MQKKEEDGKKVQQLDAQIQQVQQQYSCNDGRLFIIPEKRKWILTLCLIQIPTILHQILHLQWFSHLHYFGALYVLFLSQFFNLWTFINLCLEDPGFIQRIKYGYQIDQYFTKIPKNQNINNHLPISFVVVGKQQTQRIKLCSTCNIYRPIRTSHCAQCGACIQRMDHHCPWVGTCIGKRNYKYFYFFLLSLLVLIITIMVMCIMVMIGSQGDPSNFGQRLKIYPLSIVLVLFPCVEGLFFVGILFAFHTYLITLDQTTKQFFDQKWVPEIGNPEKKQSCIKRFIKVMFKVTSTKTQYKHKAFPYYNAQPESSSNTNNRNSKRSSDSQSQKQTKKQRINAQSSISQQSMAKNQGQQQDENTNHPNLQNFQVIDTQHKMIKNKN